MNNLRLTSHTVSLAVLVLAGCDGTVAPPAVSDASSDVTVDGTAAVDADAADMPNHADAADGAATTDAPADGGASPCPAVEPVEASPCTQTSGLGCEYGADPRRACRDVATCNAGAWHVVQPTPTGFNGTPWCSSPPPAAACPASLQAADGMACTATGAVCAYNGTLCLCTPCVSFPVGTCGRPPQWQCDAMPVGCPAASPRYGDPCATQGLSCEYGCNSSDGSVVCTGGVWQRGDFRDCPISTREAKHEIAYLTDTQVDAIARSLRQMHLATWRYNRRELGGRQRLGFILEDQPGSFAADPEHRQVDLYGFASMLAATVQSQDREIRALRRRLDALERRR